MIKNRNIRHVLTLFVVFSLTAFMAVSCSDDTVGPNTNQSGTADLSVSSTVNKKGIQVGDKITFKIKVKNSGPSTAKNVKVTYSFSNGFKFKSADASKGSYNTSTGVWTVGKLSNGSTKSLNIIVKVLAKGNHKNVLKVNSSTNDPNEKNNKDSTESSVVYLVKDLKASTGNRGKAGKYTFFSLKNDKIILNNTSTARSDSATTKWDIAFSGRTIIVNGGKNGPGNSDALVLDVPFDKVTKAPTEGYSETTLPYTEWANYTGSKDPKHAFLPKENTTLVVKTADDSHVAKIKIISWYKGNPDPNSPDFADPYSRTPGYFTFKYKFIQ